MVAQAEKERERASADREAVGTSVRASCSGRRERREWLVSAFGCSTRQNNETVRRRRARRPRDTGLSGNIEQVENIKVKASQVKSRRKDHEGTTYMYVISLSVVYEVT